MMLDILQSMVYNAVIMILLIAVPLFLILYAVVGPWAFLVLLFLLAE